jgi:Fe2+ transport system protein FeoA
LNLKITATDLKHRIMALQQVVPLEVLHPGEEGRICDICGDHDVATRLEEMGLRTGTHVRMVQSGRPCILAVDHQRLSFRVDEGVLILVEVGHHDPVPQPAG